MMEGIWWEGVSQYPNPSLLIWSDQFSLRLGFYEDYVFNRHMRVDFSEPPPDSTINTVKLFTNSADLVLNGCDCLDIFATLGSSTFFIIANATSVNEEYGHCFQLETAPAFSSSLRSSFQR